MKRITLATIALLSFFICFAQLQNELTLPGTVQRFIDEQVDRARMLKTSNANAAFNYYSQFTPSRMVNGVEMIDAFIDIDNSAVVKTLKANPVTITFESGKKYILLLRIGVEHISLEVLSVADWDFPLRFDPKVDANFTEDIIGHRLDEPLD